MKKNIHTIFILVAFFIMGSTQAAPIPDPSEFGKKLIETIRLKNKESYLKTFALQKTEWDLLAATMNKYPHLTPEEKNEFTERFKPDTESSLVNRFDDDLSKSYDIIQSWISSDSINVSKIEYLDTYFDLNYVRNAPLYVLDRCQIAIRCEGKYYIIRTRAALNFNNKWAYGAVKSIYETNEYFDRIRYDYTDAAAVVADTSAVVAMDSVAVAVAVASPYEEIIVENTNAYVGLNPKQAKKIAKMQKQIDALYIKIDKEYLKEY